MKIWRPLPRQAEIAPAGGRDSSLRRAGLIRSPTTTKGWSGLIITVLSWRVSLVSISGIIPRAVANGVFLKEGVHCKNSKNLTQSRQGAKKIKIYDEKANLSLKHFKKSKKNAKILAALRLCV